MFKLIFNVYSCVIPKFFLYFCDVVRGGKCYVARILLWWYDHKIRFIKACECVISGFVLYVRVSGMLLLHGVLYFALFLM